MKKLILAFICLFLAIPCQAVQIIYVDANAPGPTHNGSSWADAYNYLQNALTVASSGDEIRVAQGIYKPDQGVGITPGDRTATFQLINGVVIRGGYAGFGAPDPNARDIDMHEATLSGDIEILGDNSDNSYHVVTGSGTDKTAVLDGFTITSGNANSSDSYSRGRGGGMYNWKSSPMLINCTFSCNSAKKRGGGMCNDKSDPNVTNCTFSKNSAMDGGGMWNIMSNPMLINCTFNGNSADYGGGMSNIEYSDAKLTNCTFGSNSAVAGGGMYNWYSSPILNSCAFRGNSAGYGGGGMANIDYSNPTATNCTFSRNSTGNEGGGMYNWYSSPILNSCAFRGNSAGYGGGGMWNIMSNPMLINCTFNGNSALEDGGGMYIYACDPPAPTPPMLANCTFAANSAKNGNALACDSFLQQYPSNVQITNCILWDGGEEIWNNDDSTIGITYSDVQAGWPGEGNIDADPCFANPAAGDYHLLPDSACINAGDPNYVPEPNETDLDGKPRIIGGQIDMGAYEFQSPRLLYVDDDAPNDPGPGDPCVSDPLENGTQAHPFDAIQEAIDAAHDADTVIVAEGTYTEIINFKGKNIILTSTAPNKSDIVKRTTIDGSVWFRGTEDPNCTLTGFNINGYITGFDWEIDPSGKNHTHATISHCTLENFTTGCGRLIYGCDGTISNCVIANISYMCLSPWPTPAIVGCHGLIENCTFVGVADGIEVLEGETCTIKNCIMYRHIWAFVPTSATLNISYCNFEGGRDRIWGDGTVSWGPGNIDTDPCFARLGNWQVEGDYHLKSQAGRWDANEGRWTKDEVTSPCIDAGDIYSPIGYEPFPNGGILNMGAYGGTAKASKSYFGKPLCETIVAGDINGDCKVNFLDFRLMALHWLQDNNP